MLVVTQPVNKHPSLAENQGAKAILRASPPIQEGHTKTRLLALSQQFLAVAPGSGRLTLHFAGQVTHTCSEERRSLRCQEEKPVSVGAAELGSGSRDGWDVESLIAAKVYVCLQLQLMQSA